MNRLAATFFTIALLAIYACIASCSKPTPPPSDREVYYSSDGWARYSSDFNSSEKWDGSEWKNNNDSTSSGSMSGIGNQ